MAFYGPDPACPSHIISVVEEIAGPAEPCALGTLTEPSSRWPALPAWTIVPDMSYDHMLILYLGPDTCLVLFFE